MQRTIRFFVSTLLCLSLLLVSGCGGGDNAATSGGGSSSTATSGGGGSKEHPAELVGKWKDTDQSGTYIIIDLRQDGTGHNSGFNANFMWKVEGGRLLLSGPDGSSPQEFSYEISDSTLVLKKDGIARAYTKQ